MSLHNDFTLPKYGYLAFDALSMKAFLKQRLNDSGVFTDQNYEGSNISQLVDLFAYTFHTLIYYMNKTASEGLFSDAQIYENINRITKVIGYNPVGRQTSVLSYKCKSIGLNENEQYTIPRYSKLLVSNSTYSIAKDTSFLSPDSTGVDFITEFSSAPLLYQGNYREYPKQFAVGTDNETIYLNPGENIQIDHFTIDVYVKHNGAWSMWSKTPSLYLNNANDSVYEIRLSEKKHYELTFGNDICGRKLDAGDEIQIYYIASDGETGVIGPNSADGLSLVPYSSDTYDEIMEDVRTSASISNVLSYTNIGYLKFFNDSSSTYYSPEETVDEIRTNAPGMFRSQYRLTTAKDFEVFVRTNFSNLVHDVKVVNNWTYLSEYIKYFYDRGLANPNNDSRVMLNQVMYADACNFNNVYLFAVPKLPSSDINELNYLNPALKSAIIQSMDAYKVLTCEPVVLDPMYMAFGFAIPASGLGVSPDDIEQTRLNIVRKQNSRRDATSIKADVVSIFSSYFSVPSTKIGQEINITDIVSRIMAIDGVQSIYTNRTDSPTTRLDGLSLIKYNPVYPTDSAQISTNIILEPYQFPYFNKLSSLQNQINVITRSATFEEIEY